MTLYRDVDPGFAQHLQFGWATGLIQTPFRVDLFFILSGFILTYLYGDKLSAKTGKISLFTFWIKRFVRIYPLHLFTILLILVLYYSHHWTYPEGQIDRITQPGSLWLNLLMVSSWGFTSEKMTWNGPAWSLCNEWLSYLLFPIILKVFQKIHSQKHFVISFLLFLSAYLVVFSVAMQHTAIDHGWLGIIRSLSGFILGGLGAKLFLSNYKSHWNWDAVFIGTTAILMLLLSLYHFNKISLAVVYIPLPFLMISLAYCKGTIKNILSHRWLVYLGNLSFAIYMLHQPLFQFMNAQWGRQFQKAIHLQQTWLLWTYMALSLIALIVASSACYHLIESSSRKTLLKRFVKK